MAPNMVGREHFVLVHGSCHGAWVWFKLKPLLESASHRVTVLDLAASGTNPKLIGEVPSLRDYAEPLMEFMASIAPDEKVILVGHSFGGMSLALAMDHFPEKISVAVFLAAFVPDSHHRPSYVLEQLMARAPEGYWLDTQFRCCSHSKEPLTTMLFGTNFFRSRLYQNSSEEDLTLALTLARPSSLYIEDLSRAEKFSEKGFGSVNKVYIVCDEDAGITLDFQHWMIENSGINEVMEIQGADHSPMLSKTRELHHCLVEIANKLPA